MKIFWSWQSDTPGKIGRHFVRDAILGAIEDLKTPPDMEEPTQAADRGDLHLDSDRQGIPGSPDLAATIFAKIDVSAVVIADVTPVGRGLKQVGEDLDDRRPRALMNPNVAIEIGYALGKPSKGLGNNLLMICNSHYGTRSDLPFDLAHKAGPLFFDLAPDATRAKIDSEQKKIRSELVKALRPFLEQRKVAGEPSFVPTPTGANIGVWFKQGDPLGQSGDLRFQETPRNHLMPVYRVFYLRVLPSQPLATPLTRSEIQKIAYRLPYFSMTGGSISFENQWGAACLEQQGGTAPLASATQIFLNGEIWAVNSVLLTRQEDQKIFSYAAVEEILKHRLPELIAVAIDKIGVSLPLHIQAGFVGVSGYRMWVDEMNVEGPVHQDPEPISLTLHNNTSEARSTLLLALFERMFFKLVQEHRPKNYREFPGVG